MYKCTTVVPKVAENINNIFVFRRENNTYFEKEYVTKGVNALDYHFTPSYCCCNGTTLDLQTLGHVATNNNIKSTDAEMISLMMHIRNH